MAATRIYSTAAYYVAAVVAILFGLCPKFGALVAATPNGVLGGITVVLYGMIGLLGAKIWIENRVDFANPVNLVPIGAGLILAIGPVTHDDHRRLLDSAASRSAPSSCWSATTCCARSPPPTSRTPRRPVRRRRADRRRRARRPTSGPAARHDSEAAAVHLPPPETLDEALRVLAEVGDDGKVLAGGQSLVPLLNMRLAAPAHLVDINRLAELGGVGADADGVRVGAPARHADVEHDAAAFAAVPLLRQALRHVAHPTIRNRGTTVGSLVHADPARGDDRGARAARGVGRAGPPARTADGSRPRSSSSDRWSRRSSRASSRSSAFFPRPAAGSGTAFVEVARRHGDYAVCGVGAVVTLDEDRRVARARAGVRLGRSGPGGTST